MENIWLNYGIAVVWALAGVGSSCQAGGAGDGTKGFQWEPQNLRTVYDPGAGFYCYAPCIIQDGPTDVVFACRNKQAEIIRDHIYTFKQSGGQVSALEMVLGPATGSSDWDCFHVCDPSVVAGDFRAGEVIYRYAMFYLGNDVDASRNNQIGVAFAQELRGPWRRHDKPIVPDSLRGRWGTGQPSAVSLDHKGRILLFYTKGHRTTAAFVRELDLSDTVMPVVGQELPLSMRGLTRTDGAQDVLNNFDVALDTRRRRFIAVRERRPYPANQPSFIGEQIQIVSLAAEDLKRPEALWRVEGEITPALTGFARNHNAGIARTAYGELPQADRLRVFFASSAAEPTLQGKFAAWTYVLHEISAHLSDKRDGPQ